MPLLSLFSSKRHPPAPAPAPARAHAASRSSSGDSQDYVQVPPPGRGGGGLQAPLGQHTEASTSKLRLPFLRRSKLSSAPSDAGSDVASAAGDAGPPLLPPPARTSVFGALTLSSQSLPLPDAGSPISPGGLLSAATRNAQSERDAASSSKKRSSVFAWTSTSSSDNAASTSKARSKGKGPTAADDASFNLRSFKHVAGSRPTSTAVDLSSPTAPGRPRGDSVYSSSETTGSAAAMKAADFRARTRRSSTSLPLAVSPRNSADVEAMAPPHARPPRQPGPPGARTASPGGLATPRAPEVRRLRLSSSETSSESSESEDSDDSDSAPPHVRLARDSTITPRTARSEHAHGARGLSSERSRPAQGMRPPARSEAGHGSSSSVNLIRPAIHQQHPPPPVAGSVYARPRASLSTSALAGPPPSTSAANAMRPPVPTPVGAYVSTKKGKARAAGSDTSEDESDHQHDSDSDDLPLAAPPRRPGSSLSMASTGSSPARRNPKPLIDLNAPSTLNAPPPLPANLRKFERTSTDPGRMSVSVSSPQRFMSSPETATLKLADKPPPPVPTRVATREPGFAVLSRPPRQSVSMPASAPPTQTSHHQQSQQQKQPPQPSPQQRPVSSVLPRPPSGILKAPSPPGTLPGGPASRSGSPARHGGSSSPARNYLTPTVPRPPFVRGESPASSTSASSRAQPVTPRDGSELGGSRGNSVVTDSSGTGERPRRLDAHGRRYSVSFEEPAERERGRSGAGAGTSSPGGKKGESRRKENLSSEDAQKERRRNEAKAAIELGNVIHGPAPVVDDDDAPAAMTPQAAIGMGMNFNPAMYPPGAFAFPGAQGFPNQPMFAPGVAMTPNYLMPQMAPNMDPAFLAAHQQAMLAAKQAYQIAVAQQALAAAGDEWERSSNAGGWGMGMPAMGMPSMPSMPAMGMMPGMMFPAAPASVYGGGSPGSVYGGGSPGRQQMWGGTGSVYGEAFGPSTTSPADRRRSSAPMQPAVPFPASSSAGHLDGRQKQQQQQQQHGSSGQPRQRTRTAPSSGQAPLLSPSSLFPNAPRTPPSSWRTSGHMS